MERLTKVSILGFLPRISTVLVSAILISIAVAAPSSAGELSEAGTQITGTTADQHCAVILERIESSQAEARILDRICAADPGSLATTMATTRYAANLLMRLYEHGDFKGSTTEFYGAYGTCDNQGYSVSSVSDTFGSFWHDRISSFRTYGACDFTTMYRDEGLCCGGLFFSGQSHADMGRDPYTGMNDETDSFTVDSNG